ncbi:hypothetical protein [Nostoc sp. CMAA1605]|uniref:hypothetical protein n=1 Tax=Nostoc sp. CMAA1605 TaxID=2055159 RepID=UPI001F3221A6|nr:hypothetical protein [Nostoc sp. CMAA1605]MCF4969178.1 hypothetical protein [Nostoc sp. CMAA1605]
MRHNINYQDFAFTNLEIANKGLLNYWVITRLLPNMQRINIASFRSRSHAEVYLRKLRHLIPDADFVMIFDCQRE